MLACLKKKEVAGREIISGVPSFFERGALFCKVYRLYSLKKFACGARVLVAAKTRSIRKLLGMARFIFGTFPFDITKKLRLPNSYKVKLTGAQP
jgi:hypothetical protein